MAVTWRHLVVALVFIGLSVAAPEKKAGGKTVFCYYGSWASYRQGDGALQPNQIDTKSCTHVIYTFAGLDKITYQIKPLDPWNDLPNTEAGGGKDNYRKFANLKSQGVKVLLAIGGWNEGSEQYSQMVSTAARRATFISSVVTYLNKYGFQGFDFDWEWPGARGGVAADKDNLSLLLKEMRAEFNKHNFILTAASPANPDGVGSGYDLREIMKYVDFLSLMTYDYHTDYTRLGHGAPLHHKTPGQLTITETVDYYLQNGARPEQLLLGVALYGRTFKMTGTDKWNIFDKAAGPGTAGPHSQTEGLLTWFEICGNMKNGGFRVHRDTDYMAPYAENGIEWYAYDDQQSILEKVKFAQQENFGGIMIWSLENDDNHHVCGDSLTSFIKNALNQ